MIISIILFCIRTSMLQTINDPSHLTLAFLYTCRSFFSKFSQKVEKHTPTISPVSVIFYLTIQMPLSWFFHFPLPQVEIIPIPMLGKRLLNLTNRETQWANPICWIVLNQPVYHPYRIDTHGRISLTLESLFRFVIKIWIWWFSRMLRTSIRLIDFNAF